MVRLPPVSSEGEAQHGMSLNSQKTKTSDWVPKQQKGGLSFLFVEISLCSRNVGRMNSKYAHNIARRMPIAYSRREGPRRNRTAGDKTEKKNSSALSNKQTGWYVAP